MKQPGEPRPDDGRSALGDRWIERAGAEQPEARAGALFRAALRREPLEADRLAAIGARLRADRQRSRPRPHRAWRVAIALGLMLSGGAMTATANWYLHRSSPPVTARPEQPALPSTAPSKRHGHIGPAAAPAPSVPEDNTIALLDDPPPARSRAAAPHVVSSPSPAPDPIEPPDLAPPPVVTSPPSASALAEESKLLTEAMRKLRQDDDPTGALSLLDEHDVRFGRAALAPEAALARIEALMKVKRDSEALSLLDGMSPAPNGIGRDLLIARAELRAAAGRCAAAAPDFDRLLWDDPALDAITERALWGRASCRARNVDAVRARADLKDYLSRFPNGRFAAEARAALGK